MKKIITLSILSLGILFLVVYGLRQIIRIQITAISPFTQNLTQTSSPKKESNISPHNEWKKYTGNGFSFEYPSQDCDPNTNRCEKVILIENYDKIDIGIIRNEKFDSGEINEYVLPISTLYYANAQDEIDVNKYLQITFNNDCSVISWMSYNGTQIKFAYLSDGCTLWGPESIIYQEKYPQARGLVATRHDAYYNKETGTFILYPMGNGSGCAFLDCGTENKILQSIKFGDTVIADLSK